MRYTFHGGLEYGVRLGGGKIDGNASLFSPDNIILRNPSGDTDSFPVGTKVIKGSVFGAFPQDTSLPPLFTVNGKVKEITRARAVIEVDKENASFSEISDFPNIDTPLSETDPDILCEVIRRSGVATPACPLGAYSVCKAVREFDGKRRIIVDCTSAEPFFHTNRYILANLKEELIRGIKILIRATEALGAVIIVDESHLPSIRAAEKLSDGKMVLVRVTEAKYPISNAKLLMHATIGKECPPDKKPSDYGCAIVDAEACVAIYDAFSKKRPMTDRLISVANKSNSTVIRVPIGTRLIDIADSVSDGAEYISLGVYKPLHKREKLESAVVSTAERLLVLKKKAIRIKAFPCTGCMKCEDVCPMYLSPYKLLSARKKPKKQIGLGVDCCIRCNCCSAVCPSGIDIPYYFKKEGADR